LNWKEIERWVEWMGSFKELELLGKEEKQQLFI
jgi:hypothetical protein